MRDAGCSTPRSSRRRSRQLLHRARHPAPDTVPLWQKGPADNRSNQYGIAGASALTVSMACGIAVAARGFFSSRLATTTATGVVILCAWVWFIQPLLTLKHARPAQSAYGSPPEH